MKKTKLEKFLTELNKFLIDAYNEEKFKTFKRCRIDGCRYGIEGVDKYPLDDCIYCGEPRPVENNWWGDMEFNKNK